VLKILGTKNSLKGAVLQVISYQQWGSVDRKIPEAIENCIAAYVGFIVGKSFSLKLYNRLSLKGSERNIKTSELANYL
jgi:uncharacterized protein YebE (UPF0316 family)